jgi:hypothetical protein
MTSIHELSAAVAGIGRLGRFPGALPTIIFKSLCTLIFSNFAHSGGLFGALGCQFQATGRLAKVTEPRFFHSRTPCMRAVEIIELRCRKTIHKTRNAG